jgi:hypothetical protein
MGSVLGVACAGVAEEGEGQCVTVGQWAGRAGMNTRKSLSSKVSWLVSWWSHEMCLDSVDQV